MGIVGPIVFPGPFVVTAVREGADEWIVHRNDDLRSDKLGTFDDRAAALRLASRINVLLSDEGKRVRDDCVLAATRAGARPWDEVVKAIREVEL